MQSLRPLLLFLVFVVLSLQTTILTSRTTFLADAPNRLEIVRIPGIDHSHVSHEIVVRPQVVQTLYTHMLSLPVAPDGQICPTYIIANYQLMFSHNSTVIKKANALHGECQPVSLPHNDIRTADATFWRLVKQAIGVGTMLSLYWGQKTGQVDEIK